jgi:hypothetical protein
VGGDENQAGADSSPYDFGVRIMRSRKTVRALLFGGALAAATPGIAADIPEYSFPAAAQEITQLYWLAETAAVCGWATGADSVRFKLFSLRFLSAHLSDGYREALMSLVTQARYEEGLRNAALEGAAQNCGNDRWYAGWVTYKAAADENEERY